MKTEINTFFFYEKILNHNFHELIEAGNILKASDSSRWWKPEQQPWTAEDVAQTCCAAFYITYWLRSEVLKGLSVTSKLFNSNPKF